MSCNNYKCLLFHVVREITALIHIKPLLPNARQSVKASQTDRGLAAGRLTPSAKGTSPRPPAGSPRTPTSLYKHQRFTRERPEGSAAEAEQEAGRGAAARDRR